MKLKTQIIAIVAVPVIGIAIVSGIGLRAAFETTNSADAVLTTVSHAVPVGDLIHELQVERGMSAGFLSSGGVNFKDALPAQRSRVDAAISGFQVVSSDIAAGNPAGIDGLEKALGAVKSMRARVSDQGATVPEMAGVFTAAIRAALSVNMQALSEVQIAEVGRAGAGWISLSEAKESAGLERAMGAVGFGSGQFPPNIQRRYDQLGAMQDAQLSKAELFLRSMLGEINFKGFAEYKAVEAMRAIVDEANGGPELGGVTAPDWFATSTAWIESLRTVEITLGENAVAMAEAEARSADLRVISYGATTLLALVVSAIGGWVVSRGFARRLHSLGEAMDHVAKKEFDTPISTLGERSEIGALSQSLDDMRAELEAADMRLREAFSKSFAYGGSSAAMVIIDPDLKIVSTNAAAVALFKAQEENIRLLWPDFDADALGYRSVAGLAGTEAEMKARFSDPGALPWLTDVDVGDLKLEFNVTYVETEDGAYAGNVLQLRDVTLERLHAGMVESIERDQCVAELTLDGTIVRANDVFAKALDVEPDSLRQRKIVDLCFDDDPLKGNDQALWDKISRGEADSPRLKLMKNGSEVVWMRAAMNPVLDADGRCFKIALLGEDITFGVERYAKETAAKARAEEARNLIVNCLADGLSNIAAGNLTYRIDSSFDSEFDDLRVNFNKTVEQLAGVMSGVLESVDRLRASSSELKSASGDLARRTEGQAATLEETAAALDEITATVQTTASESKSADSVVAEARDGAERGSRTVSEAITAMDQISESSKQISSIIKVIDDISFQTNLLALNAGVEAARAGEAGRGFAVVASEVRALAQRAAEAAREIGELITTSRSHVDDGVALVGSAGEVLGEIANLVVTASERVAAIRQASEEQATGLAEINTSVNSMDQATQQNAAMVEEASALSTTLSGDADDLARLVSAFETAGGQTVDAQEEAPRAASA